MDNQFGTRLGEAIKLAGKDRQEVADAIGISVQALSQLIIGKSKSATAENTAKAAKALGVDFYWLATGQGKPVGPQDVKSIEVKQSTEPYSVISTTDEIIELIALYQQASKRGRENILDLARSAVKQTSLRWRRVANES